MLKTKIMCVREDGMDWSGRSKEWMEGGKWLGV